MKNRVEIINKKELIISPVGNIDFSNSQVLKEELLKFLEKGYQKVIIDFSEVESIDSSGLGKILLFHKRIKEKNGELIIKNVKSSYIKNMFELIHLNKVIDIENDLD